ncbi:phage tail assembly protein [Beijerinckia indica]|uniref:Mu-like prophage FluMu gp41 family protein n=1 Tax=Beijerinckia indica subsp. indica (strain ATCC 9039 / DSM 1715 / NCIMB 8712) TaxID=395963 RepID=B2ICD4_BEII9|nr:phage tail assembly protein [Beijerinckia indica]ACB96731.1 hypothetical protein Bind_3170 [Beijerinckia indica subsp. indica ATCC 9039]
MAEENETIASAPRFIGGKTRVKTIRLEYPLEYNGREYREISIARLTVKDVEEFIESLKTRDVRLPIYRDEAGDLIPEEVLDALDDDDLVTLEAAARDFLPRRFQGLSESGSDPGNGATIEPTSNA